MENLDENFDDEFSNIQNLLSRAFLEKSRLLKKGLNFEYPVDLSW